MSHKLVRSSPDPWPPYVEDYLCSCGSQIEGNVSALVCVASGRELKWLSRCSPIREVTYASSVAAWILDADSYHVT